MQLIDNTHKKNADGSAYSYPVYADNFSMLIERLCWLLLGAVLVAANIAKHSVVFQAVSAGYLVMSFFHLLVHNAIRIIKYHIISMLFILYNIILIFAGTVVNQSHSYDMVKTISINLFLSVMVYSLFLYTGDKMLMLKTYVNASVISAAVILYVFRGSLFSGRLAFSWGEAVSDYSLLGIRVITAGSNGIGLFSSIAFILSTYLLLRSQKIRYFFYDILFMITVLATGSRKGLIILILGFFLLINLMYQRKKKLIIISIGIVSCILLYYLIIVVPALYEVMGSRVEEFIHLIWKGESSDTSINTRIRLLEIGSAMFRQKPIFGYGLDAFRVICPWGIVTDNNFLEIVVSSGILGFFLYYSYVPVVFYDYIKIQEKSEIVKLFFWIFLLLLCLEYGSVIYFERNYDLIHCMLFFVLFFEKGNRKYELPE